MVVNKTSKCESKGASTWLTCLGFCAIATGATVDVECFFCKERKNQKRNYKSIWQRLESLAQVYIVDVHVIDVLFDGQTM